MDGNFVLKNQMKIGNSSSLSESMDIKHVKCSGIDIRVQNSILNRAEVESRTLVVIQPAERGMVLKSSDIVDAIICQGLQFQEVNQIQVVDSGYATPNERKIVYCVLSDRILAQKIGQLYRLDVPTRDGVMRCRMQLMTDESVNIRMDHVPPNAT